MQSTPLIKYGNLWVLETISIQETRSNSMLWNRVSGQGDAYNRWGSRGEMYFQDAHSAIALAVRTGMEYEVIYANSRYHSMKSYSDNFVAKKDNVEDVDEEEISFSRI